MLSISAGTDPANVQRIITMAKIVIPAREVFSDDVTGHEISDGTVETVKITVDGGKAVALDMTPATKAAFVAFLTDPTDETRMAFADILTPAVTKSRKSGNGDTANVRAWLVSLTPDQRSAVPGYKPEMIATGARGKLPDSVTAAYAASQASGQPTPATGQVA
jgi:hypothetical protein